MSLHPEAIGAVPEATARAARASFPKGTACLRLRDKLGAIFDDEMFAGLYPKRGQPAYAPWRLALVTVLQFAEGLSDRQAADAVRGRLDWKYALGLELDDPGFDASILCEFRARLLDGGQEYLLLDALVDAARGCGVIRLHGRQRTDATHVLAAVRALHRLELVGESLRAALNAVAAAAPAWLAEQVAPSPVVAAAWVERYGARVEAFRLPPGKAARAALVETIGDDGHTLLAALWSPSAPSELRGLPAVERLRRIWVQQFYVAEAEGKARQVRWRDPAEQPPAAQRLASPYDAEARIADKRSVQWLGYKVHLTETCEADEPLLIVAVETTPAPQPDRAALTPILNRLAARDLLPAAQLVDTGYVDAAMLVAARDCYGVDLVGPAMPDLSRQGRAKEGYDLASFVIDWAAQRAVCPAGQTSVVWSGGLSLPITRVRFDKATCRDCRGRQACTGRTGGGAPRQLHLRPQLEHEALQARRREQETEPWEKRYAARAGIEGTISQAVRGAFGLRRTRYLGLAKTRLQHLATAAAINWTRLSDWLNQRPRAKTRQSHLSAALKKQPAAA
ncbi:MAG TPA: IS1182 family transposase [Gemmatirosa sp.]